MWSAHSIIQAWLLISFPFFIIGVTSSSGSLAKKYPGSSGYPSIEEWQTLNSSIHGKLLKFSNPGIICYGSTFNKAGCAQFKKQYNNASFMGEHPGLINWPQFAGNPCPPPAIVESPGPGDGCTTGRFPDYVVAATDTEDVSAALRWASKKGVRVVVKNTGHDFLGRNVGYGSLSIWTKNIKGVSFTEKWNGTAPSYDVSGKWKGAAFTYGSGELWRSINGECLKRNHIVVAGIEGTVGAGGGWLLGGGHGPFSNQYGLGVEQVLEFQVVTPDGEVRIANAKSNSELFWALRGGGASTYGIVTRISYKAYPAPKVTALNLSITPKNTTLAGQDSYYQAMGFFLAMFPNFTDFGLSGYPTLTKGSYTGLMFAPGKTEQEILDFFAPIEKKLISYGINVQRSTLSSSMFLALEFLSVTNYAPAEPSGLLFAMSSRLFSRTALREGNVPNITKMLKTLLQDSDTELLPYPNMPGAQHQNRTWDFGLNPAWRTTAMHMVSLWNLDAGDNIGQIAQFKSDGKNAMELVRTKEKKMTEIYIPAMDALSENSGAYINEGFYLEKDWKKTFYGGGERYEKLLSIKNRYDPQNVLWCFPCVGGDVFIEREDGKLYHS